MYYVYILKSRKNKKLYVGYSRNLKNRIIFHNSGRQKSTRKNIPYKLIWFCVFSDKTTALRFERYIKSGSGHAFMRKRLINTLVLM